MNTGSGFPGSKSDQFLMPLSSRSDDRFQDRMGSPSSPDLKSSPAHLRQACEQEEDKRQAGNGNTSGARHEKRPVLQGPLTPLTSEIRMWETRHLLPREKGPWLESNVQENGCLTALSPNTEQGPSSPWSKLVTRCHLRPNLCHPVS